MLFERLSINRSSFFVEGLIILLVSPWLLLPQISFFATTIGLLSLIAIFLISWRLNRRPLRTSPLNGAMLLIALATLVGTIVTADRDLTLPKATGIILGFAVFHLFTNNEFSREELKWSIVIFFIVGSIVILVGFLGADWRLKLPLFQSIFSTDRIFPRLIAIPGGPDAGIHTNQLAGVFMFYLPIVGSVMIGFWFDRKLGSRALLAGIGGAIILVLLLFSQSRSGWLGALIGFMFLFFIWGLIEQQSRKRKILLWLFVILLLAMIIGSIWLGPNRLANLWDDPTATSAIGGLDTIGFRQEVWRWAVTAVGDFPFTGTGLGTFREVVRRLYPINISPDFDIVHAHNLYLQVALDLGILGLVGYLALVGIGFYLAWCIAINSQEYRPLAIGIMAGLAAYHIYSLTDALALGSKPGIIFWLVIGLLIALYRQTTTSIEATGSDSRIINEPS